MPSGPYPSHIWSLGGRPTVHTDVPITAVFLGLYVCGAITMMTIFQLNRRRGHKFIISSALFGFCMSRTVTTTLRIVSICLPSNHRLALAASIFTAAGVLLLFIINLIFAQRVLRSTHPHIGWSRAVSIAFISLYALVFITIVMVITAVVQSAFTLDLHILHIDRGILLYGGTCFAIISALPIPIILFSLLFPRHASYPRVEKFGAGRHRTKIALLLVATAIISSGAWWRCATTWKTPVPLTAPCPWYFHRPFFYVFDFGVEVIVIALYALLRVDRRFHIPNGASGPGSYAAGRRGGKVVEEEEEEMALDEGISI